MSVAEAKELIAEAVALGLITEVTAPNDKRYKLYKISHEQLAKLNRIREREARIYAINDLQAANPNNVEAGKTEAVASWYSNIMEIANRKNDVYLRDKKELDALRYLLGLGFSGLLVDGNIFGPCSRYDRGRQQVINDYQAASQRRWRAWPPNPCLRGLRLGGPREEFVD